MFRGGDLKLKELANLLLIKETIGNMDVEITGLEMDSRKITDGDYLYVYQVSMVFLKIDINLLKMQ